MEKNDFLQMIEHPERYSDEALRQALADEENAELLTLLSETQGALDDRTLSPDDVRREWARFERRHGLRPAIWQKVAAIISIVVLMSGLATAVISTNFGGLRGSQGEQQTDVAATPSAQPADEAAPMAAADTLVTMPGLDSLLSIEPVQLLGIGADRPQTAAQGAMIESLLLDYYRKVPQDRIFVHTDKSCYAPGDTVWLRAHLTDGASGKPMARSRYVYVELYDHQADTLVRRMMLRADGSGIFANALPLPGHLAAGSYTLAAYTGWMRNFGAGRFFYKQLQVVSEQSHAVAQYVPAPALTPTTSVASSWLQVSQRKGHLLIRPVLPDSTDTRRMACVLYGSGNLLVVPQPSGRIMRIDSRSLRTGGATVALVDGTRVVAQQAVFIEGGNQPAASITGRAGEEVSLNLNVCDADGQPLRGTYSISVTDADVVQPDTLQADIAQWLLPQNEPGQTDFYPLQDVLAKKFPRVVYGIETSQSVSGRVSNVLGGKIRKPQLTLFVPSTGYMHTYQLGDSSRFTLSGLDFPDGAALTLEGTRRSGETRLVRLSVDEQTFPRLQVPRLQSVAMPSAERFVELARQQQQHDAALRTIELDEVVKIGKKRPKPINMYGREPSRSFAPGDPRLERATTLAELLHQLGILTHVKDGMQVPYERYVGKVYVDNFIEDDMDFVMQLMPNEIESIEYFGRNDPSNVVFGVRPTTTGDVPGVLFIFLKSGYLMAKAHRENRPLSSVVSVQQLGYQPEPAFSLPQTKGADHRTTLYWNPRLRLDGTATVRFPASSVSRRYLVTLQGVSDDGTVVSRQVIIE